MSAVPNTLRASLAALAVLLGAGGGAYVAQPSDHDKFLRAVAGDPSTSEAVKIAMVMGAYYESSNRHIGLPYVDKAGKGQPLTVCNGITGAGVVAGRYYTPYDCYALEKGRYLQAEKGASGMLNYWPSYTSYQKATFIDFAFNKGLGALSNSTMRRKANAGDIMGACAENKRWNRGTVNGVSKVLPGLNTRAKSNAELCAEGL